MLSFFKKRKGYKEYKKYIFKRLDKEIAEIEKNKNMINSEFLFDTIKKYLFILQTEYGSIKDYLIYKYSKKDYKFKYFLYNDIETYLNLLFKDYELDRNVL